MKRKTNIKKIIPLIFCCGILASIIVVPEVLNRIFPFSKTFKEIYNIVRPYGLYIILPLLLTLWIYLMVISGCMDKTKKFNKVTDILESGGLIMIMILLAVLLSMIIHLILSRYAQNYAGNLINVGEIKIYLFGGIIFVLCLCGSSYINLLVRRQKGNDLSKFSSEMN